MDMRHPWPARLKRVDGESRVDTTTTKESSVPVTAPSTISVIARFTAQPGKTIALQEFLANFTAQVRSEPGNLAFLPFQDVADPSLFTIFEQYDGQEGLDAHSNAAHVAEFRATFPTLAIEDGPQLTWLSAQNVEPA